MKYTTSKDKPWMRDATGKLGLLELINYIGDTKDKSMIEIGSFAGESTVIFASAFKSVTAIDPFLEGYDKADPTSYSFDFQNVYQTYLGRTGDHKNIQTIVSTSSDALSQLEGLKFDFIYIDGLHTYDGVKEDIKNYLPLVKEGGYIGGHDYGDEKHQHLIGVTKAVNEMIGEPDKVFADHSWIKKI